MKKLYLKGSVNYSKRKGKFINEKAILHQPTLQTTQDQSIYLNPKNIKISTKSKETRTNQIVLVYDLDQECRSEGRLGMYLP